MSGFNGDPADQAQEFVEAFPQAKIAEAVEAVKPQQHPDFDGIHCLDCDVEIPAARLAMGRIRCVACQSRKDGTKYVR